MKKGLFKTLLVIVLLSTFSSCGSYFQKKGGEAPDAVQKPNGNASDKIDFATIKNKILTPHCIGCHTGRHKEYENYDKVKESLAEIIEQVNSNQMPKGGQPLSDDLKKLLVDWQKAGAPEKIDANAPPPNPPPAPPVVQPNPNLPTNPGNPVSPPQAIDFAMIKTRILTPHCISCHENEHKDFESYSIVKKRLGGIIKSVNSGKMPKGAPSLSEDLKKLLVDWQKAGAPEKVDSSAQPPVVIAPPPDVKPPTQQCPINPPTAPAPPANPPQTCVDTEISPTWKGISSNLFFKKCTVCHRPGGEREKTPLNNYENIAKLRDQVTSSGERYLDLSSPDKSYLLEKIEDEAEPMPPFDSMLDTVTEKEKKALIEWIKRGIPND